MVEAPGRPGISKLSPVERQKRARIGGLAVAALYDPKVYTATARRVFLAGFMTQVDPDGELRRTNPKEAERRAEAAKKLHMARLAFNREKAKKQRRATAKVA